MTWTGWEKLRNLADKNGIIYKRGDSSINPYVQAIDDLLMLKNATDVGLIFEDERGTLTLAFDELLSERLLIKHDFFYIYRRVESEPVLSDRKFDNQIGGDR